MNNIFSKNYSIENYDVNNIVFYNIKKIIRASMKEMIKL